MKKKYRHELPKGWTLKDVQAVAKYYDNQSEEEGAAEIKAGGRDDEAVMPVPRKLVPQVRRLIALHADEKKRKPPAKSRRVA